jgi:integrase
VPKISLNERVIRKALKGEPKIYIIDDHPGLYLSAQGEGRGSFFIRYRPQRGAQQRYFTITTDARNADLTKVADRAAELLLQLRVHGIDPHDVKEREARDGKTYNECFAEWLENPRRKKEMRGRTREEYERIHKLHVAPYIGTKPLRALDKAIIRDAVEKACEESTDKKLGFRGLQGTKALRLIRSVCEYAIDHEYIVTNPTRGILDPAPQQNPKGKQHSPLTDVELRLVWNEAPQRMSEQSVRMLQLILLLGKRVSEIVGIGKDDVVLGTNAYLKIPGTREGNKSREDQAVPLPSLAESILRDAIAVSGDSPFVFPQRGKPSKSATRWSVSLAFAKLRDRLDINERVRLHDARGLIVDHLSKMGVPSEYRSHVLHHVGDTRATLASSTYSTYDHMAEKRRALDMWQRRLLAIVNGQEPPSERW